MSVVGSDGNGVVWRKADGLHAWPQKLALQGSGAPSGWLRDGARGKERQRGGDGDGEDEEESRRWTADGGPRAKDPHAQARGAKASLPRLAPLHPVWELHLAAVPLHDNVRRATPLLKSIVIESASADSSVA
ncbi:unnamed protein product [Prorocentrum cordatum]|uniref:Uncharacterized protein n=1 Tax=Prorocentrum cordatum TaxID=2364126 RepID=A0ABN9YEL0_9DINO|nr:unnamed protein product [Polarella glacialis]